MGLKNRVSLLLDLIRPKLLCNSGYVWSTLKLVGGFFSDLALFEVHCVQFLPNGTNVFKSGPPAKTTICTVSRGRLRRRNQTKRNLPLAFQFVCGPPLPPGRKQIGRQVEGEDHKKP